MVKILKATIILNYSISNFVYQIAQTLFPEQESIGREVRNVGQS